MKDKNLGEINHQLIADINKQVLALICTLAVTDRQRCQIVFGLPEKLCTQLSKLTEKEICNLSEQPTSILTLRDCANESLWKSLLMSVVEASEAHLLNLNSLLLMHAHSNHLVKANKADFNLKSSLVEH